MTERTQVTIRDVRHCDSLPNKIFTMTGLETEPGTKPATNSLYYDKAGYFKLSPF